MYLVTFAMDKQWDDWYFDLLKMLGTTSFAVLKTRKDKIGNNGFWEERAPTDNHQRIFDQWWKHGTDIRRMRYLRNREEKKQKEKNEQQQ